MAPSTARLIADVLRSGKVHRYADHRWGVCELHLPKGAGPHPVAIVLHGGSWKAGYDRRVLCAARLEPQTGRVAWSLRQAGIAGVQDHVLLQGGLLVFQPSGASGTAWIDLEDGSYRSSPERALPVAVGGGLATLAVAFTLH